MPHEMLLKPHWRAKHDFQLSRRDGQYVAHIIAGMPLKTNAAAGGPAELRLA